MPEDSPPLSIDKHVFRPFATVPTDPNVEVWRCGFCFLMLHRRMRGSMSLFYETPGGARTADARKCPCVCPGKPLNATVVSCRVCGCTDDDCKQCIKRNGVPCTWADRTLCSACIWRTPEKIREYLSVMDVVGDFEDNDGSDLHLQHSGGEEPLCGAQSRLDDAEWYPIDSDSNDADDFCECCLRRAFELVMI